MKREGSTGSFKSPLDQANVSSDRSSDLTSSHASDPSNFKFYQVAFHVPSYFHVMFHQPSSDNSSEFCDITIFQSVPMLGPVLSWYRASLPRIGPPVSW